MRFVRLFIGLINHTFFNLLFGLNNGEYYIMHTKNIFLAYSELLFIIVLSLLAGYNVFYDNSKDFGIYYAHYNSVSWDNYLGDEDVYFEYLYKLLVAFSVLVLRIDYYFFASLIAFVSLLIKFLLFSKRPHALFLKIAYLLTLFPYNECLRTRSALALAFVFLAVELRHRKFLSLILVLFGAFMHYSFMPFVLIWFLYHYLDDIKKARVILGIGSIAGIVIAILFKYIEIILGFVAFIDPRIFAYFFEDEGYFNVWILPKYFLLGLISYLVLKNKLDSLNTILIFIATSFIILSFSIIKINMLSLGIFELGFFAYFLVVTNRTFTNKSLIRFLFLVVILMDFAFKILQLPVFILWLLK